MGKRGRPKKKPAPPQPIGKTVVAPVCDGHHNVASASQKKQCVQGMVGEVATGAGPVSSVRNVPRGQRKLDCKETTVLAAAAGASDTTSPSPLAPRALEKIAKATSATDSAVLEKSRSCATPGRNGNCRRRRSRSF